jgi:hypothetical protein
MTIDDRNPFLDGPQTFTALFQNYDLDSQIGQRVLLKRRASPRFNTGRLIGSESVRMGDPIRLPAGSGSRPTVARVEIGYNFRGRALRFLYQIPEMRAAYASGDGSATAARVSTEVASGGMPLNFLPGSLAETVELFRSQRLLHPWDSLAIAGAGRGNFETSMRVEYYSFPEFSLGSPVPPPAPPDLPGLVSYPGTLASRIEFLGGVGVTEFGPGEVIGLPDTHGYVEASGFAVEPDRAAREESVWIKLDGKLYPVQQSVERPEIVALLRGSQFLKSGFRWFYPTWKLGASEHTISLVVISSDRLSYHEVTPRRFRIVRPS